MTCNQVPREEINLTTLVKQSIDITQLWMYLYRSTFVLTDLEADSQRIRNYVPLMHVQANCSSKKIIVVHITS